MADAVEMVARLLTIVEDRERYRDDLDFENKRAEALSNEVLELRNERDVMRAERDRARRGLSLNEQAHVETGQPFNPMPTSGGLWSGRGIYYDMIEVLDNGSDRVIVAIEWIDGRAASTIGRTDALALAAAIRRKFGVVEPIHGCSYEQLLTRAKEVTSPEDAVSLVQDLVNGDL